MKQYITINKKIDIIDEVHCNNCFSCITEDDYVSINHTFGYFSDQDGNEYEFDLCEKCFMAIISKFKIKPNLTSGNY